LNKVHTLNKRFCQEKNIDRGAQALAQD